MAVSSITVTSSWVQISTGKKAVLSVKTVGNENLLINSEAADSTAEQLGPSQFSANIIQDEEKDVWVRSDSDGWTLILRTAG